MKIALSIPDELFESGETLSRRLGVSRAVCMRPHSPNSSLSTEVER